MKETEVKILEINRNIIEQTLTAQKAQKIFDADITTIFLDFNDKRIQRKKNSKMRKPKRENKTF